MNPLELIQIVGPFLVLAGVVFTGAVAVLNAMQARRSRQDATPETRLAEAQFAVQVYEDRAKDLANDKQVNDGVIATLREYIADLESRGREASALNHSLYQQIYALEARNSEKDALIRELKDQIARIASKLAQGLPITIADITGYEGLPEDLEDTVTTL